MALFNVICLSAFAMCLTCWVYGCVESGVELIEGRVENGHSINDVLGWDIPLPDSVEFESDSENQRLTLLGQQAIREYDNGKDVGQLLLSLKREIDGDFSRFMIVLNGASVLSPPDEALIHMDHILRSATLQKASSYNSDLHKMRLFDRSVEVLECDMKGNNEVYTLIACIEQQGMQIFVEIVAANRGEANVWLSALRKAKTYK